MKPTSPVIVALDYTDKQKALAFVDQVNPSLCSLKVGKALFTYAGPDFVRDLVAKGFCVFLDLKFHDIPNTVAEACSAAATLGVWMLNVHASGGAAMMKAARHAIDAQKAGKKPLLIAVTVLTSLNDQDLHQIGMMGNTEEAVLRLAKNAKACGLDGVVCSAEEATMLRHELGGDFLLITPGIRLEDNITNDQKRVMTPQQALAAGSDYLVIGRSITSAEDPVAVLRSIHFSIKHGIA
ncbi:MAG: orotidine 5'-phosphate decarboxylase [Gammaproteobacteria bacterium RIFCSPHIGHO2_12_FULL_42_13]|nr:MAG: orotidine 5'-phosphate decarboxylase [Gammaproteobacteria bacterium RIFCSPHIGHO2_12_FULL_42_13]